MKNDHLCLPYYNDIYGKYCIPISKRASGSNGLNSLLFIQNLYIGGMLYLFFGGIEYLDTTFLRLFRCITVNIFNLCVDDGCIISRLEREDNEKKNCRSSACIGWSGYCLHTIKID